MCFGLTLIKKSELENLNNQISVLTNNIEDLKKEVNLKEPVSLGAINWQECFSIASKYGFKLNFSDEYFQLTTVEEAKLFCEETKVKYGTWVAEKHDCDNFSFALLGYWSRGLESFAFGYARSSTHAFNVMIDKDKVFWIVEPQTNVWLKYEEVYKNSTYPQYQITEVLM